MSVSYTHLVDLSKIFKFEFIRCRFGHIPKTGYKTLITYLDNLETFFIKTAEDATDVWGFYFAPVSYTHLFVATKKSRGVLPSKIDFKDAVFNVGHASMFQAAMLTCDMKALEIGVKDKLCLLYTSRCV